MKNQQGQSLLLVTSMIFIFIIYSLLLTSSVLNTSKVTRFRETKEVDLWIAEAGIEKALYCFNNADNLNCGGTSEDSYVGESAVPFDVGIFSTSISTISADERAIVSTASYKGIKRTVSKVLYKNYPTDDVNLDFAIAVGDDGLHIDGNSQISGDIYSNGDVICTSGKIDNNITVAGTGRIYNCKVTGDATANTIEDSDIDGDAYYQTIINSDVDGTSYPGSPDPPALNSGITTVLIDQWKLDAAEGTYIDDNLEVDSDMSLGPAEITGNLILFTNNTLTITGVIYVHGNIVFESNGQLTLHSNFAENSGVVLADGNINMDSVSKFTGTPEGGLISLISTSFSDPAIDFTASVAQSGSDVSICAPNGGVIVSNGAKINHACGASVTIDGGAKIQYTEGAGYSIGYLSDINAVPTWEVRGGTRNE